MARISILLSTGEIGTQKDLILTELQVLESAHLVSFQHREQLEREQLHINLLYTYAHNLHAV